MPPSQSLPQHTAQAQVTDRRGDRILSLVADWRLRYPGPAPASYLCNELDVSTTVLVVLVARLRRVFGTECGPAAMTLSSPLPQVANCAAAVPPNGRLIYQPCLAGKDDCMECTDCGRCYGAVPIETHHRYPSPDWLRARLKAVQP